MDNIKCIYKKIANEIAFKLVIGPYWAGSIPGDDWQFAGKLIMIDDDIISDWYEFNSNTYVFSFAELREVLIDIINSYKTNKHIGIRGDRSDYQKIINTLKLYNGTEMPYNYMCNNPDNVYYIGFDRAINAKPCDLTNSDNWTIYTIDEFNNIYDFKIGDEITIRNHRDIYTIINMFIICDEIYYKCFTYGGYEIVCKYSDIKHYIKSDLPKISPMAVHIANNVNCSNYDKVEIKLGDDWEIKEENGKTYAVRKKTKITEDQLLDNGFSKCGKLGSRDPDYVYTGIGDFYTLDMWLWINPGENFCSIRYNDFTVYPYKIKDCVVYDISNIKDIIDLQYSCLTKYREVANKFNSRISILELIKNEK